MIIYKHALFIFRRDLRLYDNSALEQALAQSGVVTACFIFDERQVGNDNSYKSKNALEFMVQSLKELEKEIVRYKGFLNVFYGQPEKVVKNIIKKHSFDALFCNRDYTPFSQERDTALQKLCHDLKISFNYCNDYLLQEPEGLKPQGGSFYRKFTPFYKKASTLMVRKPSTRLKGVLSSGKISSFSLHALSLKIIPEQNPHLASRGGRSNALAILKKIKAFSHYEKDHNFPAVQTTYLSAHLKFGTVSVREVYYAFKDKLGENTPLIRQLYWRDFFTHIAYHCPSVFGHAFQKKYDTLSWNYNNDHFRKWREGKTGFPIVDAGMRELNTTGFMHNRVRLITGSFLTKDLHINWQQGEKYFAQNLIDYDPSVNNGNWQWVASTGCDAQPYFRIFNPWLQQKKFDPECVYIKKWIPELADVPPKIIHSWHKKHSSFSATYPKPMVDHTKESLITKNIFKHAK